MNEPLTTATEQAAKTFEPVLKALIGPKLQQLENWAIKQEAINKAKKTTY